MGEMSLLECHPSGFFAFASSVACIKFKFKAPLIRVVMDMLLLLLASMMMGGREN